MGEFTHFDQRGNAVMVDVTDKAPTSRAATASGEIQMTREAFEKIKAGDVKKGDVLGVARIAGISGVKRTFELIPLCHMLNLTGVEIQFHLRDQDCTIETVCTVKTTAQTGVEMEALTGVTVALLTIYDMCKAVDKGMQISNIRLLRKSGGKSGNWVREEGEQ